jgi:hypothetical protein
MAESTLSIDYAIIHREVGRFLGMPRTSWSSGDLADLDDLINAGLRRFYAAYRWTFLRPIITLTTNASYTTGTVAIASGVVTLTAGTFPTWAAQGDLIVSGVTYSVNTRDSGTQITLDDLTVAVSSGASYTLGRPAYTLSDDFGGLDGPLTYQPGVSAIYGPIEIVPDHQIRSRRQRSDYTGRPRVASLRPITFDPTVGQRWEIHFDPIPDGAYVLTYRYKAIPNTLTTTNKYPLGGVDHNETILESCLAKAELRLDDNQSNHETSYQQCLADSIQLDRQQHSPDWLGQNLNPMESYDEDGTGTMVANTGVIGTYNGMVHYD